MSESITITITRDELWDAIAHGFDAADGATFDDEDDDYHDYYWEVTDTTFKKLKERQ